MIQIELPRLYERQHAAIYADARYVWIEASTKSGKTAGCIVWQLDRLFSDEKAQEHWWVAPVYNQARIAFRRAKRMLTEAGMVDYFKANESELTIELTTGARWCFKSAEKSDNLYGEDVADAVLDEASRMRESSWFAVRSTLTATRGPVRGIGNVKGRKNWFYRVCRKAEQGLDDHAYFRLTAWDAVEGGVLDEAEIVDAKSTLPEHVFRELYLAEPSEDGSNPFGQSAVELQTVEGLSDGAPVAWGWDLAKSYDWTVGIALDAEGRVCRFERFQGQWESTIEKMNRLTDAFALVDSTGVGDPIVERLPKPPAGFFQGFKFTASSKQQLMERLSVVIQSGEVWYPEGPISEELLTFEFEHHRNGVRYTAPPGLHDDCVCALALAVRAWDAVGRVPRVERATKIRKIETHNRIRF